MKKLMALIISIIMLIFALVPCNAEETPRAVRIYETTSYHGSFAYAQEICQDYTLYGRISYNNENDYYKVIFNNSGKANFWLGNIPSGNNYDLYIYNSSQQLIGQSTNLSSDQESVLNLTVYANNTYYIKVKGVTGTSNSYYMLRAKWYPTNGFKYYCNTSPSGSIGGFSTTNLQNLYTTSNYNLYQKLTTEGCFVTSYAMILHNLNKLTTAPHYDPRTLNSGYMQSDPVTVMMANMGFPIPYNNLIYYNGNPVDSSIETIAQAFGADYGIYNISSLTRPQKIIAITYYLTQNPEGVTLVFEHSKGNKHAIVASLSGYTATESQVENIIALVEGNSNNINKITNDNNIIVPSKNEKYLSTDGYINDSNGGSYFTVYDPADHTGSTDGSLSLSSTWTAHEYSWSELKEIRVFG